MFQVEPAQTFQLRNLVRYGEDLVEAQPKEAQAVELADDQWKLVKLVLVE